MRSFPLFAALAILATGCKTPDTLGDDGGDDSDTDLASYSLDRALPALFTEFEGGCDSLKPLVVAVEAGLVANSVDLTAENKDDRSYSIAPLPHEGLDVTAPPGTDPADQTPVVAFGLSTHDIDTNIDVALEPNQVCIESNSTVWYGRTYTEGTPECLKAGTCDVLRSANEVRKELIIAKAWYEIEVDFRKCTLDDGRVFLAQRAWSDKSWPGDKGSNSFAQSFVAQLWIDDGAGKTKRVYAIWPEIDIGLPAGAMTTLIRDSLIEGFDHADAYADVTNGDYGGYCENDRDAAKPPRG